MRRFAVALCFLWTLGISLGGLADIAKIGVRDGWLPNETTTVWGAVGCAVLIAAGCAAGFAWITRND